jgi:hypothetical protein
MKRHQTFLRSALLALIFAAGGCAMTQVSADYDPTAPFGQYRTFAISSSTVMNQGQPDNGDQFLRDRVSAALAAELQSRGLQYSQQNPDLTVKLTTQTATYPQVNYDTGWDSFWGWGWGPYWGYSYYPYYPYGYNAWVTQVQTGTVTVEVFDAHTNKLVYRASAQTENPNFRRPKDIQKVMDKALKAMPAPLA